MYTLSLRLGYPAAANAVKHRQEVVTPLTVFGEGDICFVAKELGKVVIARSEYVDQTPIQSTVNHLDIFHLVSWVVQPPFHVFA